jgi:hypothetical protein
MAETLQEGCEIHGLSKDSIKKLAETLKKAIKEKKAKIQFTNT